MVHRVHYPYRVLLPGTSQSLVYLFLHLCLFPDLDQTGLLFYGPNVTLMHSLLFYYMPLRLGLTISTRSISPSPRSALSPNLDLFWWR
jgi:hypothetical protein